MAKDQQMFAMFAQDPYITYKPESSYYLRYPIVQKLNSKLVEKILPKPEEVEQLLRDRQQVQNEQEALAALMMEQQNGMGTPQGQPQEPGPAAPQGPAI
jgi:hypothetical protein